MSVLHVVLYYSQREQITAQIPDIAACTFHGCSDAMHNENEKS